MAKATQTVTRKKTTVTIKPKSTSQKNNNKRCPTCGKYMSK